MGLLSPPSSALTLAAFVLADLDYHKTGSGRKCQGAGVAGRGKDVINAWRVSSGGGTVGGKRTGGGMNAAVGRAGGPDVEFAVNKP